METGKRFALVLCACVLAASRAGGQYTNRSTVLDASGAFATNGSTAHLGAAAQAGGIAAAEAGPYRHQAGFLTTFLLKPDLDTDGDGVADELDADNDADGLADSEELEGSRFAPLTPTLVNLADTDGDGRLDGWEAAAGTDPTDPAARLQLLAISNAPAGRGLAWLARGGGAKIYLVRAAADARLPYEAVVFSNTVPGGVGPWYAVTAEITHVSSSDVQFYAVEVLP